MVIAELGMIVELPPGIGLNKLSSCGPVYFVMVRLLMPLGKDAGSACGGLGVFAGVCPAFGRFPDACWTYPEPLDESSNSRILSANSLNDSLTGEHLHLARTYFLATPERRLYPCLLRRRNRLEARLEFLQQANPCLRRKF